MFNVSLSLAISKFYRGGSAQAQRALELGVRRVPSPAQPSRDADWRQQRLHCSPSSEPEHLPAVHKSPSGCS